jgi:hypothetical protein
MMAVRSRRLAWVFTLAATVASTYALDVVATTVGVLLSASGLLAGVDWVWLWSLLVASYGMWGLGLRANVAFNWALLEQTGLSTNLLSKGAYEFALARGRSRRVQCFAAGFGYVITEVAKEVPYYAGAFGASLLTETVTSTEAIVFLVGANLGAAAYEYGLAFLTRALLLHRPTSEPPAGPTLSTGGG